MCSGLKFYFFLFVGASEGLLTNELEDCFVLGTHMIKEEIAYSWMCYADQRNMYILSSSLMWLPLQHTFLQGPRVGMIFYKAKPLPVWMMHMSVFLLVFGDVRREAGLVDGDGALRQDHDAAQEAQKVCAGVYMGVTTSQLDELAAETAAAPRASQPDYASVHSLFRFVSPLPVCSVPPTRRRCSCLLA
ncbi:Ribonucleoside-diphosphate reductase large subunit [Hordeum vulgare]|nr:Ribonucleoside-diphosphate reductase large subunit [Hordeum vulgare]